jgi:hypothetical protein
MAKQSFSVGQVLTANQMLSLQQTAMLGGSATAKTASYTLVAADAGTVVSVNSTSATTITVNTGLFSAGDTVTIQNWGSGLVTITAGTATVNTAGSLIVPQYDGGVLYFTSASAAIYFDFVQAGAVSPLTTKGDLYTFGSSDTRIGVGANDTVLTADSSTATGLKWAAPASGGMTLLSTTTLSGATTTISGIVGGYKSLVAYVYGVTNATANGDLRIAPNGDVGITGLTGHYGDTQGNNDTFVQSTLSYIFANYGPYDIDRTVSTNFWRLEIPQYTDAVNHKTFFLYGQFRKGSTGHDAWIQVNGLIKTTSAITSLVFNNSGGNLSTGTVLLYGVN